MVTHGSLSPQSSVQPPDPGRIPIPNGRPQRNSHSRADLYVVSPPEKLAALHGTELAQPARGLRRSITREQGCALEMVSHAVDYLYCSYLYDGPEDEILDAQAPAIEAARILAAAQQCMLASLPLVEPLGVRLRRSARRMFRRMISAHRDVTPV